MKYDKFVELMLIDNHVMNPNTKDDLIDKLRDDIGKLILAYKKVRPTTAQQQQKELLKKMDIDPMK